MTLAQKKSIPSNSGVYIFWCQRTPLYIGKALNLKKRLASYFQGQNRLPVKIQKMLREATRLETIETKSEIEALITEAELIKKYRPKYNVLMRDDKNYFFVGITQETFPRIFTTHQPHREGSGIRGQGLGTGNKKLSPIPYPLSPRYIGPFTSVTEVKTVLKLLRRVFPYCTCKGTHKRPCLSSQIGKCPGYCCVIGTKKQKSKITKYRREYRKNIKKIIAVLTGKKIQLVAALKKEMKAVVKRERYEEAGHLRDQIFGLEGVFSHQTVLRAPEDHSVWHLTREKLQHLLKTSASLERIEGYDISNISGAEATGSMVVFVNGIPDKSQYRKFKIKTVAGISDVAMLQEVIRRRFRHPEWPHPHLIVIDGGKGQLSAALKTLRESKIKKQELRRIIVTALAKKEEVLYTEARKIIHLKREDPALLHLFQRIRDESHRFARSYHHQLRRQALAHTQ